MTIRYRTMSGAGVSGTSHHSLTGRVNTQSYSSFSKEMYDDPRRSAINPFPDKPVISRSVHRRGGIVNGRVRAGFATITYSSFPGDNMLDSQLPTLPDLGEPTMQQAALEGTRRANPSNPSIMLPVTIGELRELPRMLSSKYRGKQARSNSIAESEFGWAPMISDIRKLFKFPDMVESRVRTIQALRDGPMRRMRKLGDEDEYHQDPIVTRTNWIVASNGGLAPVRVDCITSAHTDFNVSSRWSPSDFVNSLKTDEDRTKAARMIVMGLHPQQLVSQAWELLPWSWLIDWFGNFGDILSLSSNSLAVRSGLTSVSKVQTLVRKDVANAVPSGATWVTGVTSRRVWLREILSPLQVEFTMPLLTHRQVLILSSIAFNIRRGY